jgi:hypothetical protein
MLATLLPGIRDLRTPLATGYLWLVALWLVVHNHVPKSLHEAHGPLRSLYELGGILGQGALVAAVSFIAYIMGSILLVRVSAKNGLRTDSKSISPSRFLWARGLNRFCVPSGCGHPTLHAA